MAYRGDTNAGVRHGVGTYRFSDELTYTGEYINGKRHGHGRMLFGSDGQDGCYEGEFVNGEIQGTGRRTWADGRVSEGMWAQGEMSGYGTFVDPKRDVEYQGVFCRNRYHGAGALRCRGPEGQLLLYTGQFDAHLRHGEGREETLNESGEVTSTYEGSFVRGKRQGRGIFESHVEGWTFDGMWVGGVRQGEGVVRYLTGRAYAGPWSDDAPLFAPHRAVVYSDSWTIPEPVTSWPPPTPVIAQGDAGSAAPTPGPVAAPSTSKPGAKGLPLAAQSKQPLAAAEPATSLPLHRKSAILVAPGGSLPAITIRILRIDANAMAEAKTKAAEAEIENAAAHAALAAASAAASLSVASPSAPPPVEKGGKPTGKAGVAKGGSAAVKAHADAAVAAPSAGLTSSIPMPAEGQGESVPAPHLGTLPPPRVEPWEVVLAGEDGRVWEVVLVRRETEVTLFSAHVMDARARALEIAQVGGRGGEGELGATGCTPLPSRPATPQQTGTRPNSSLARKDSQGPVATPTPTFVLFPDIMPGEGEEDGQGWAASLGEALVLGQGASQAGEVVLHLSLPPHTRLGQYTMVVREPTGESSIRGGATALPQWGYALDVLPQQAFTNMTSA